MWERRRQISVKFMSIKQKEFVLGSKLSSVYPIFKETMRTLRTVTVLEVVVQAVLWDPL